MSANTQFANPPPAISLPNMSVPPPAAPNLSAPPPNLTTINTSTSYRHGYTNHREGNRGFFKPFRPYHAPKIIAGGQDNLQDEFDGKRLRKSVMRKTVDYNSAIIKSLEVNIDIVVYIIIEISSLNIAYKHLNFHRIVYGNGIIEIDVRYNQMLYITLIYSLRQVISIIQ